MEVWPYILPLPSDRTNQRRFLISVFGSDIAIEILRNISLEGKVYQRDLIKSLKYSNKTIIKHLKTLVSFNVLDEGMEKVVEKDRTLWLKWYTTTNLGKWVVFLFVPPEKIDNKALEKILEELFELYIKNAVQLCKKYAVDPKLLEKVFNQSISE